MVHKTSVKITIPYTYIYFFSCRYRYTTMLSFCSDLSLRRFVNHICSAICLLLGKFSKYVTVCFLSYIARICVVFKHNANGLLLKWTLKGTRLSWIVCTAPHVLPFSLLFQPILFFPLVLRASCFVLFCFWRIYCFKCS